MVSSTVLPSFRTAHNVASAVLSWGYTSYISQPIAHVNTHQGHTSHLRSLGWDAGFPFSHSTDEADTAKAIQKNDLHTMMLAANIQPLSLGTLQCGSIEGPK